MITSNIVSDAILRRDFQSFLRRSLMTLNPAAPFLPNWHINAIANQLERVRRGEITRLIINMPPRNLKSLTVSVAWPAYLLGHDPGKRIISISYGNELSTKHASDFRLIVESIWYKRAFRKLRLLRSVEGEANTTEMGFRKSTSVSGFLTGLGGDIFIIDDPQKPEDAQSESLRDRLNNWVSTTLMSRLDRKDTGAIIVVMQRLHLHDLSGFLTSQSSDWTVLSLPAIAEVDERVAIGDGEFYFREAGEALHPRHESLATLDRLKQTLGSDVFTYGPLAYLLKNRTYLGESGHKGAWYSGEHDPIVDRETFEKVQTLLKTNSVAQTGRQQSTDTLLTGLLFDDRGNRMGPSYTVKGGVRYPFYVSSLIRNGRKALAGSIKRISGPDVEAAVLTALKSHLRNDDSAPSEVVERHIARVVIHTDRLTISLKAQFGEGTQVLELPWQPALKRQRVEEESISGTSPSPDPTLVQAIVRAHSWLKLLQDGTHGSIESLATAIHMHPKVVRNRIGFAFLTPSLTRAIIRGEQPSNLTFGVAQQLSCLSWDAQHRYLESA